MKKMYYSLMLALEWIDDKVLDPLHRWARGKALR